MLRGGAVSRMGSETDFRIWDRHISELDWAADAGAMDSTTPHQWEPDFEFKEGINIWPETGYGGPHGMAQAISETENILPNVHFGTVVTEIRQTTSTVILTTEANGTFAAKRVIVTLPLGPEG